MLLPIAFFLASGFGFQPGAPITAPKLIHLDKPDCGKDSNCYGLRGDVTLVVDVLEDGSVGKTEGTGDPRLVAAAIAVAKNARFAPGKFKDKPTSMNFDIHFHF